MAGAATAMIFAAGLGTRLKPLTDTIPKALVPVDGMPLLELQLRRLKFFGFEEVVVNVHHFADKVIEFLKSCEGIGIEILVSDERDELLETGGGLMKASPLFSEADDVLVMNVDVLSNINLAELLENHRSTDALATLAVRNRETSRYLLFDQNLRMCGWKNVKTGEEKISRIVEDSVQQLAFSGIQVLSQRIFDLIKRSGKFSIIDSYIELSSNQPINAFVHDQDIWMDVGKPENLNQAADLLPQIDYTK